LSAGRSLQALESLSTFTLKGLPSAGVAPNFGGWGLIIKVLGLPFSKGEVLYLFEILSKNIFFIAAAVGTF